ncbi:hypothetical protein ACFE04_011544 [Oxalis oulophora]
MTNLIVLVSLCLSSILLIGTCNATDEERKGYIVYMGAIPNDDRYLPTSHHANLLQEVTGSKDFLIRSYKRSFNGFAAKLTDNEAQQMSSMENVVSVFPSRTHYLETTRSWDFMGFNDSTIKLKNSTGSDIIIGVIDSGVWPESPSFSDEGFGPAPKKWKGVCKGGANFTCNNKVIGARFYGNSDSSRDYHGHGSHTASTAAGNKVKDTSFFGLAKGIARGGLPSARIATYKVCGPGGCPTVDIMAAFDDAIADGVDIITISIGSGPKPDPLDQDVKAIGGYHAVAKGIVVTHSAGNNGPKLGSTKSTAPWMFSVAASTTDRVFVDKVVLGNGKTLSGLSINSFSLNGTKFPLAYGKDVTSTCEVRKAQLCSPGCMDPNKVQGKIVLCDTVPGYLEAANKKATGAIVFTSELENKSSVFPFPGLILRRKNYDAVKSYLSYDKNAKAEILKSETSKDSSSPTVALFSSRGPNPILGDILKPDISAPGVNILAAFSPVVPPSKGSLDTRRVGYNVMSGTSMACPHVAGVVAYIKSVHPDWSPSAIKSAIMTTARPMSPTASSGAEFAYGSGHINPVKAANPGLVFDSTTQDFINMFCGLGFTDLQIKTITGNISKCEEKTALKDLNYPSLSAVVKPNKAFTVKFHRRVTNVGSSNSTYKAKVVLTTKSKLKIRVTPSSLSFKSLNKTKTFIVTVKGKISHKEVVSAEIQWSDGIHLVRSPIVIHTSMS